MLESQKMSKTSLTILTTLNQISNLCIAYQFLCVQKKKRSCSSFSSYWQLFEHFTSFDSIHTWRWTSLYLVVFFFSFSFSFSFIFTFIFFVFFMIIFFFLPLLLLQLSSTSSLSFPFIFIFLVFFIFFPPSPFQKLRWHPQTCWVAALLATP